MIKVLLAAFIAWSLQSSLSAQVVLDEPTPSKRDVLKKVFPGGEIKEGTEGGEFMVLGGEDNVDPRFFTDVITDQKSASKRIWKCAVQRSNVVGDSKRETLALVLYAYRGVGHAECCAENLKLVVLSSEGSEQKVIGSFNFDDYIGHHFSVKFHDLNGDGRQEIFVEHTESLVLQNHGTKLAILGFMGGELKLLWYDYIRFDNRGSGRVPDEIYYESFERKLDLKKTVSEGGEYLYFEKKVHVEKGVKLAQPKIIIEKKAILEARR